MDKQNKSQLSKLQINSIIDVYKKGKFEEAIDLIKDLNKKYPNEPLLFNIIGACYKSLGQIDASLQMFEIAVKLNPSYSEAYFNLGVILRGLKSFELSIENYKKAILINPNYPDAYNNLGNTYREVGKIEEAIENYEWAIAYKHDFFQAYNNLGLAQMENNQQQLAIKSFKTAIRIAPEFVDSSFNLGIAFFEIGKNLEAKVLFEQVLKIDPSKYEAYRNLANTMVFDKSDKLIPTMNKILKKKNLDSSSYISLNFALARVYEDLGDTENYFKFLDKGNQLRKDELKYSINDDINRFSKFKKIFKSLPLSNTTYKHSNIRPIFIVGMPRSGTSLVEQILASHSEVFGAGELKYLAEVSLNTFSSLIEGKTNKLSKNSLLKLREKYFNSIERFKISKNIFTDKMPLNFQYIGFILTAMPEAKIVHIKRDAKATCWSNYKNYFTSEGNGFSFNQKDLASYYGLYLDLMNFWRTTFPNKIYDLNYEDLTINQEEETKKLLEYCGLDWDENCLNFHQNERAVKTISALQVRKKMYQGSSESWKKYKENLKPLIQGLKKYKS